MTPDLVRREAVVYVGNIKLAAYRLYDAETDSWGKLQFHMTYDNTVIAVAGEEAAQLFATFVNITMKGIIVE